MATQTKDKKSVLRRSALAYVGLYGLAYDRAQLRRRQAKDLTENLFENLSQKGETTVKQAEVLIKQAQKGAWKGYTNTADKVTEALPVPVKSKVNRLEDELSDLQAKLERMTKAATPKKAAKKTTAKKTTAKKTSAKKPAAKKAPIAVKTDAKPATPIVETVVKAEPVKAEAPVTAPKPAASEVKTPRHVPYFLDVKRYDPLANEDIVRKIVNHCGIALRSEDARYVACSDESERVTVRDSWLKRKLNLVGTDAELDKKVLEVCDLMQRDQKKNRVTFYYLLAKKDRKLDIL